MKGIVSSNEGKHGTVKELCGDGRLKVVWDGEVKETSVLVESVGVDESQSVSNSTGITFSSANIRGDFFAKRTKRNSIDSDVSEKTATSKTCLIDPINKLLGIVKECHSAMYTMLEGHLFEIAQ